VRSRLPLRVLDAAVACGVAVVVAILIAGRQEPGARHPDVLAFLLGVAVAAPLLVRRRWPLAVLLVSVLVLVAYHALAYPAIGLAMPLAPALYTAAQAGRVRAAVGVVVGLEVWALTWRALGKHESLVRALGAPGRYRARPAYARHRSAARYRPPAR
jgi:hypothetical protein